MSKSTLQSNCAFPFRCSCVAELGGLHERLAEACVEGWPLGAVQNLYLDIVIVLACLLHNNPDPSIREGARAQLMHPVYAVAKASFGEALDRPGRLPWVEVM